MLPSRLRSRLLGILPPASLLALALVGGCWENDRGSVVVTGFLALVSAGVLATLALGSDRAGRKGIALWSVALLPILLLYPPDGASQTGVVFALLAVAIATQSARVARRGSTVGPTSLGAIASLTFAAGLLLGAGLLWSGPLSLAGLARLAIAPWIAATAWRLLAGHEPVLAAVALAGGFSAGPGWSVATCAALLLLATLARWVRHPAVARGAAPLLLAAPALPHEAWWSAVALAGAIAAALAPWPRLASWGRLSLAALCLTALLGGSLPWIRPAPLSGGLAALVTAPLSTAERPVFGRSVALGADTPRLERTLSGTPITGIVVDSFLSNSIALPCGTEVGQVTVEASDGSRWKRAVRVGDEAGEWAARRSDVAVALSCHDLAPALAWPSPAGRFLAVTFRARLELPAGVSAGRLWIERDANLPASTGWVVLGVSTLR